MLVGVDLGFPRLVLVVVLLLFVPVISFLVRRKWRHAAARREEIKRLLILASEEAARAELEDNVSYSSFGSSYPVTAAAPLPVHVEEVLSAPAKPTYQCAVCFSPTTTRCSKCKAVRYCSGKCQIIHWRQGHKDECLPFVNTHNNDDVGDISGPKILKQDVSDNYADNIETEAVYRAKPAERFSENPIFSHSSHLESLHRKDDAGGNDYHPNKKAEYSTIKSMLRPAYEGSSASSVCSESSIDASASTPSGSDSSGSFFSADVRDEFGTIPFSDRPSVNSVDSFSSSGYQTKTYFHGPTEPKKLHPLGLDGSNELEPSTSAGFWEGTIQSRRSTSNVQNDAGRLSSHNATDRNITDSQSSLSSLDRARRAIPSLNVQSSNVSSVKSYVAFPTTSGIKGSSTDKEATFSKESCGYVVKKDSSSSSVPKMSRHIVMNGDAESQKFNSEDMKSAPLGVTSSRPVTTDRSIHVPNNNTSSASYTSKPSEAGSSPKASERHSPSCTRRRVAQSVECVKVGEGIHDQPKISKVSGHYPSEAVTEMAGGYGSKGLFPYDLFVKLFNSKKVELYPCGLKNCGNSCYANAVLQCLAFTPPLTAYLLQGVHSKSCVNKEWCFTCEFESLVRKAKDGDSPLSPIRILSQLKSIGSHLGNGREEDAHEFLRYVIDTMQSVCLREAKANALGSVEEETTLVGLTFGGSLRSKIKCMRCGFKSEQNERMMDLTVEIEGNIRTLEEALNNFTGTEILDGDNKYQCSRCKSYEKAKKRLSVLEAPNVLTIALKRFQSGKFGKLNKSIQFPEILDLAPYVSGTSDKSPVYRLYGVVVHVDIMNAAFSGHYVCYVKNVQNKWFKIDDSKVKEVELQSVLTKGAYMLLYARCSPRAPRSIRNSLIPHPRKQRITNSRSRSYSRESRDFSKTDNHMNDYPSSQPPFRHRIVDEDSSSDHSSSIFSESCSCSSTTESSNSNIDSSSTEDYFDKIFGDLDRDWNNNWMHSSEDSDTSSSSSSSPSPLYSRRRSPLADTNRYSSSGHDERGGSHFDSGNNGNWSRFRSKSSKEEARSNRCVLASDGCRKLGCSSSCRVTTNSDRLD